MTQTATRTDRLKAAHDKLTEAVESIVSGDDWQRMLKVASKFHKYSFNNHLMIFLQRPEATLVAGFRKWQELDRQVRKGEKGIAIFAPCKYRTRSRPTTATRRRCSKCADSGSCTSSTSPRPTATRSKISTR